MLQAAALCAAAAAATAAAAAVGAAEGSYGKVRMYPRTWSGADGATIPEGDAAGGWGLAELYLVDNDTNGTEEDFPTSTSCVGEQSEYGVCELEACTSACTPVNCVWRDWSDWVDQGGCNGLCQRKRTYSGMNNECGKPCDGEMTSTKTCPRPASCSSPTDVVNCELSDWSSWTICKSEVDQKTRDREVVQQAENGGAACEGALNETAPCGSPVPPVDCKLSDWHEWTACSLACGGGWKTKYRTVSQESQHGGQACAGTLVNQTSCNDDPCTPTATCKLSDWSDWTGCDSANPLQRHRSRRVVDGGACEATLREVTGGCSTNSTSGVTECEFTPWEDWEACSATCDGGQRKRHRILDKPAVGSHCNLTSIEETEPCGVKSCSNSTDDCQFKDWGDWSECRGNCSKGVRERNRSVVKELNEGEGCRGPVTQITDCDPDPSGCVEVDCQWGAWEDWSACTCSCGGGRHQRSRAVKVPPMSGGKLCSPGDKSQVNTCNTNSCEVECRNGTWLEWSDWSSCSASCGAGFQSRERDLGQEADSCGQPAYGDWQEYRECEGSKSCEGNHDCEVSDWSEWSDCSCTCFGVRESHRSIVKYAAGDGKPCSDMDMKVVMPCNPGPAEQPPAKCDDTVAQDCQLEAWGHWSFCPVTCGGGQMVRQRHILSPPSHGGKACEDPLSQTTGCGTAPCNVTCIDCVWDQWTDWGDCTCGRDRSRTRKVLQMPNSCGERCDARPTKEAGKCPNNENTEVFCSWSPWTAFSECSADCGPGTKRRQRTLGVTETPGSDGYLFKGKPPLKQCSGTVFETSECNSTKPCPGECTVKIDCNFSDWGDWETQEVCTGLCDRSRSIAVMNNACGEPCNGPLTSTQTCESNCTSRRDCELWDWGPWSACPMSAAQKYRVRAIKTMPANGGDSCSGDDLALEETAPCNMPGNRTDCQWADWSVWSRCSETCGGGWQMRNRCQHPHAKNGGTPCNGTAKELQACNTESCGAVQPCVLGDWEEWTGCRGDFQRSRARDIVQQPQEGGAPCNASLEETQSCGGVDPQDCVMSDWTDWAACSKSQCGGGQQERHRQIDIFPLNGGKPCDQALQVTRGCNCFPCESSSNCELSDWSQWSTCDAECGTGQVNRTRKITQNRNRGGEGCNDPLQEVKGCQGASACSTTDCKWADWSAWSGCSCTCGGGIHRRTRGIGVTATKGGQMCPPGPKQEVEGCNTQSCAPTDCKNGSWNDWSDWSACTTTCGGGTTWRQRNAEPANYCGQPAIGPALEMISCNLDKSCEPDVDCVFADWGDWTDCTKTEQCSNGFHERTRVISTPGSGDGTFCVGPVKEIEPCNVCGDKGGTDCVWGDWGDWEACPVTCDGGQSKRVRAIATEAADGGNPCNGTMEETSPCANEACPGDQPVDCVWGDWEDWSACTKCQGQRSRHRSILTFADHGGEQCKPGSGEETGGCARHCHERKFCVWQPWQDWDSCTVTCGNGRRKRERTLTMVAETSVLYQDQVAEQLAALARKSKVAFDRTYRSVELALAFGAGCLSLVAALATARVVSRVARGGGDGDEAVLVSGRIISRASRSRSRARPGRGSRDRSRGEPARASDSDDGDDFLAS